MVTLFKKIKNLLKNKKGSSLLLVMMTSSIIIVVGTSMLFLTLTSFTRSMADYNRQKAFESASIITDQIRSNMGSVMSSYKHPLSNNIKDAFGESGEEKVANSESVFIEFDNDDGTTTTKVKIYDALVSVSLKATACDKNYNCSAMLVTVTATVKNQTEIITFLANNSLIDIDYLKESLGNSFVITDDFGTDENPIACGQVDGDLSINVPQGVKRVLNANIIHGITGSIYANGDIIIGASDNIIKIQGNIYVKGNLYLRGFELGTLLPSIYSNKCGTTEYYNSNGVKRTATYNQNTGLKDGGNAEIGEAMYDIDGKPMQIYSEHCNNDYYAKISGVLVPRSGVNRVIGEAMYDEYGEPQPQYALGGNIYVDGDIIFDRTNVGGRQSVIYGDMFCTGRVIIAPHSKGVTGGVMLDEPDDKSVLGTFSKDINGKFNGKGLLNDFDANTVIGLPVDSDRESVWHRYQYTYYDNANSSYRDQWKDGIGTNYGKNKTSFVESFYNFINAYRTGTGKNNIINAIDEIYKSANNSINITPNSNVKAYNKTTGFGELSISIADKTNEKSVMFVGKMYILNDKNNDGIADDSFLMVNGNKVFNGSATMVEVENNVSKPFIDALTVYFNENLMCNEIYANGNINLVSSKITNNTCVSNLGNISYDIDDKVIKNAFSNELYINNYVDNWSVESWVNSEYASDNWKRWQGYLDDARPTEASGNFVAKYYIRDSIRKGLGSWNNGYAPKDEALTNAYKIEDRFIKNDNIYIEASCYNADLSFNPNGKPIIFDENGRVCIDVNVDQKYDNYVALYTNKIHPYAVSTNLLHTSAENPLNYANYTGDYAPINGIYKSAYHAFEAEQPYNDKKYGMYLRESVRNFTNIDANSSVEDIFAEMFKDDFVAIEIQRLADITPETVSSNTKRITSHDRYGLGGTDGAYMWFKDESGNTILAHSKVEKDPLSDSNADNYIYEIREDYYFDFNNQDLRISSNWDFPTQVIITSRTTFRAYTGDDPNFGLNLYIRAKSVQFEKVTFEVVGAGNLYIYLVGDTNLKASAPSFAITNSDDATAAKLGTHIFSDRVNGGTVMIIGAGNNKIEVGRGGHLNGIVYVPEGTYENASINIFGNVGKGMSQGGEASIIAKNISIKGNNVGIRYTAFDPELIGFGGARFQFEMGEDAGNIWEFGGYITG